MHRLTRARSGLSVKEYATLARLSSPIQIQDFLDTLPMNWEKSGETLRSPRGVLNARKAHCFEGALVAAAALWIAGEPPLLMDLTVRKGTDDDHVVALYRRNGLYGAISKTNHATLRFRDPIYRTPRELALSYFHEWFLNSTGEKTLEKYSRPFNLARIGPRWVGAAGDLWDLDEAVARAPHYALVPSANRKYVRKADRMERKAGALIEWRKSHPRT